MEDAPRDLEQQLIDILRAAEGPADPSQKKRGAQPGNQNARRNGRYSRHLPVDRKELLRHARETAQLRREIHALHKHLISLLRRPDASDSSMLQFAHHLYDMVLYEQDSGDLPLMTKPGGCFAPAQNLAQKMRIWYESPSYERIPKTTSPPTAAAAREN